MEKTDFDALYISASTGNKDSYRKLYSWFQNLGNSIAIGILQKKGIYTFSKEDLGFYIAEVYLDVLRTYAVGKIPFHRYAETVLKKRMTRIVANMLRDQADRPLSLDTMDEDGIPLIEKVDSGDYEDMILKIETDEHRQIIASKSNHSMVVNSRIKKLMKFREAGMSKKEICRRMNLTDGQYRYMKRSIRDILNSTIEMK